MLHGTGASIHSFAELAELLAPEFRLLIIDLPGHGASQIHPPEQMGIAAMASNIRSLLEALESEHQITGLDNRLWIGHSAGAVIAVELALQEQSQRLKQESRIGKRKNIGIFSINGAFLPFAQYGLPGMETFAKTLAKIPLIPAVFALQARHLPLVDFLTDSTGSKIPQPSKAFYKRLVSQTAHNQAALTMMAWWNLREFSTRLIQLNCRQTPLHLFCASNDRTVPPSISERVQRMLPEATIEIASTGGHLVHEEIPHRVLDSIKLFVQDCLNRHVS